LFDSFHQAIDSVEMQSNRALHTVSLVRGVYILDGWVSITDSSQFLSVLKDEVSLEVP
jgi:hypothetical protein